MRSAVVEAGAIAAASPAAHQMFLAAAAAGCGAEDAVIKTFPGIDLANQG